MNAPFTWPNSSLSIRLAGTAPQFTLTQGPCVRGAAAVQGAGDQLLARARLARDQDGGVGAGDAIDFLQHREERAALPDHLVELVLGPDFLLQVHVLGLQAVLQALDLGERLAEFLFRLFSFQFDTGSRRKGLQDRDPQWILGHRLVIDEDHVADDAAGRVPQRHAQEALGVQLCEQFDVREVLAHVVRVEACLARGDRHARCVPQVVFEGRPKAIHPQRAGAGAAVIEALGDIHTAHLERAGQVLDERGEEFRPGHVRRALRDRLQQFFG